jgi:hypothetical protein
MSASDSGMSGSYLPPTSGVMPQYVGRERTTPSILSCPCILHVMTVRASSTPDQQAGRSRLWIRLASVGALLVLLVALGVVSWSWRHPTVFERYGNGIGRNDVKPGSTVYATVTYPGDQSGAVTIHGVAPHDLQDSTDASFAYYLCMKAPGPVAIGVETQTEMRGACTKVGPAVGATMSLHRQQLLVAVTPHRTGVVVFHGVDVHYSHGWQNGTQRTGFDTSIRVIPTTR